MPKKKTELRQARLKTCNPDNLIARTRENMYEAKEKRVK